MVVKEIVVERGNYPLLRHTEELALISCSRIPRFLLFTVCNTIQCSLSVPDIHGVCSCRSYRVTDVPCREWSRFGRSCQKSRLCRTPRDRQELFRCRSCVNVARRMRSHTAHASFPSQFTHIVHASFPSVARRMLTHIAHASFPPHAVCSLTQHSPAFRRTPHALSHIVHASFPPQAACSHT